MVKKVVRNKKEERERRFYKVYQKGIAGDVELAFKKMLAKDPKMARWMKVNYPDMRQDIDSKYQLFNN